MKALKNILITTLLLVTVILLLAYDAYYSAPSRYTIRYETLESVFIPEKMNDVSILFFSDLDYGTFMDQKRMKKLVETINGLSPDVVIFGGDVVDREVSILDSNQQQIVSDLFYQINAPLGKFAVMGDCDRANIELTNQIENILYDGEFEILNNKSLYLRNESNQAICLVGIDNMVNGYPDISAAYANVSRSSYVITISHTPDIASNVPTDLTNYFLSGHSHGGQVYWGLGSMYIPEGATNFFRGKFTIDGTFDLDITNGVGTTIKDIRFLANAEVVLYRLKSVSITDADNKN